MGRVCVGAPPALQRRRRILFLIITSLIFISFDCDCGDVRIAPEPGPEIPYPTLIYPQNNSGGHSQSPIFIWDGHCEEAGEGTFEFTLEVLDEFSSEILTIPAGTDTIVQYPDTLNAETLYRWRVTTEANDGETAANTASFNTGTGFNNPPSKVWFTGDWEETTNHYDVAVDAVLTWYCFDPDGDDLYFELWYRRDEDSDSIHVFGIRVMEYTMTLDADTRYTVWVIPFDEHGSTRLGAKLYLNTIATPPPHDPDPPDGATDVPPDIILSWSCTDPDADDLMYDVDMGRAGGSMSRIATGIVQDELPVVGLTEGVTHEWKVTAEDDDGHRTEGPAWSFTTVGASGDVFADLSLTRQITKSGTEILVIDNIWARFDDRYAPYYWLSPLRPDTVICEDIGLVWQDSRNRFYYENAHTLYFLVPGTAYEFSVAQGGGVPALTRSILFPHCAPQITSPAAFEPISLDGFTVTWTGYDEFPDCDRQVSIAIEEMGGAPTDVYVTTENDGSYTFTAGELSAIDPSLIDLQIVLVVENIENIDSPGYDPRSWIRARTLFVQPVYTY